MCVCVPILSPIRRKLKGGWLLIGYLKYDIIKDPDPLCISVLYYSVQRTACPYFPKMGVWVLGVTFSCFNSFWMCLFSFDQRSREFIVTMTKSSLLCIVFFKVKERLREAKVLAAPHNALPRNVSYVHT